MKLHDAITLIKHNSIAESATARWIDLGCGDGLFTYALANLLQKGSEIYAVDKSSVAFKRRPNPNNITIHTKQMDFTKQPLAFGKLDGILMANSLHYVADKINFIDSVSKQLTANGIFLIVEYDTSKSIRWVPYPVTAHALELLFTKAGYHSFTRLSTMSSVYNTNNLYAALIKR